MKNRRDFKENELFKILCVKYKKIIEGEECRTSVILSG
jgi:hypothetical protein